MMQQVQQFWMTMVVVNEGNFDSNLAIFGHFYYLTEIDLKPTSQMI